MWGNRCYRHDAGLRNKNRTAHRQRIGSRARCRADYQTVSLVSGQLLVVDFSIDGNHRSIVALQYGYVVQCAVVGHERFAVRLYADDGTLLNVVFAANNCAQLGVDVVRVYVGKEAQSPHVYTDNGNLLAAHSVSRHEESAVAAHRDDEVGREVVAVECFYAVETDAPVRAYEFAIFAVDGKPDACFAQDVKHALKLC